MHLKHMLGACALTGLCAGAVQAKGGNFGGAKGADLSIEAIEPADEAITIGKAGDYPADIARYLLASGASGADLSPDGKTIAFIRDITGTREIWVMPASGGQPKQITFRTGVGSFDWTPDSQYLMFAADRDGNEQPGYFALRADGLVEKDVLPAKAGDFRQFGGFADGGSFLYASTARNGQVFDIYRGTMDGESKLVAQSELGLNAASISPDGRYALITETVGEDADNLYLLDLASGERRAVAAPPVEDRASHTGGGFAWLPDSSAFYFASNEGREYAALSRYDLENGTISTAFEPEADVGSITLCGDRIAWTENEDGFHSLHLWHLKDQRVEKTPKLPEGVYRLDCEGDPARLMVAVNGWRTPGEIWMVDPTNASAEKVFASNLAGLDPARLVRPQVVRYPARDGVELQGLLFLPENAGRGREAPPVLFMVHGGPTSQSQTNFNAVAQYHVNRGVAVFAPNIRGSTGLGRTYAQLDDRRKRLDSIRDLVDLLEALGNEGLVDADRAVVMGGSYGGYAVNAVLAAYPEAFDAGIALYGVADWVTALEIASPSLKASDRIEYGDITEDEWREFYSVNSPIRQADRIRVPVLYSHGVMDPRIDIAETEVMVTTLRENGVRADFIRFSDEGHGWRKLSNQLFYYREQAEFVEEVLGVGGE